MAKNSYEKPDFWSQKAFSEGYPARSVYKLKEIDEKFGFIKKNYTVLDLGSAPGSWTTFLLRKMEGSGKVVSCDLNPLSKSVKGDNLFFIQGDLNDAEITNQIKNPKIISVNCKPYYSFQIHCKANAHTRQSNYKNIFFFFNNFSFFFIFI